jgi:predicted oxidoreductase
MGACVFAGIIHPLTGKKANRLSMLQSYCSMPLLANQVEINIDNMDTFYDGTLDQCQEYNISPMAWCPLGGVVYPAWGKTLSDEQAKCIDAELELQAEKYETEKWIVTFAWLLKHPADILPIVGSTQPARIRAAKQSLELDYTAVDWYRLLQARNGQEVA